MEAYNPEQLTGLYLAYKRWELIWLENKELNQKTSINYFDFEKMLHTKFDHNKCTKILEQVNCGDRKVILDFDNKEAKVVIAKDEPFENIVKQYLDPKFVANRIENPEDYEELYSKSKADIRKL